MTLTERDAKLVLAAAMSYDNRKPGDANIAAWLEAGTRGRWTLPEALDAVHEHYTAETQWIMPGHVTQAIRARRQDAAMRAAAIPPPPPDAIGQARAAELVAGGFRAVPDADDAAPAAPAAPSPLERPCPFCDAKPGDHCTRRGITGRVRTKTHPSRLEAPEVST